MPPETILSTLEKTIALLEIMPEEQINKVYNYACNVRTKFFFRKNRNIDEILASLVGSLPDEGKTLEDYRNERLEERYGPFN